MNFMHNGYDIYAGVFFEAMAGFISRFGGLLLRKFFGYTTSLCFCVSHHSLL